MRKYLTVFGLSLQGELTYRLNFVLWRFRNVLRILMTFFLWNAVFSQRTIAFGYTQQQMFAYIFLVLIVSAFVTAGPSNDNMGSEIGNGDLSNFLIKPIGYLRYWLSRDWSSKLLNICFAFFEVTVLWWLLKPAITFTSDPIQFLLGIIMCVVAAFIYFVIAKLAISIAFWKPEDTWTLMFLLIVFMETLAGVIFPLDILSDSAGRLLQLTPFPYMIYYPIATLVGRVDTSTSLRILFQSVVWLICSSLILKIVWNRGLKIYSANGK
jgi:ABC-2 type transport system permease protein